MELTIGSKVILLREMLGEKVGSIGYVYETYPDFDESGCTGVSIIFSCGGYGGFSAKEQDTYLEFVCDDPRYSMYKFKNVNQVYRDFQRGYWRFD